ncbi:hypothetical protein L1887_33920 [Cichorium endivia]|nr:hypothetical protein L1887_44465 [Cichorium endivia]KAI3498151.1 hypothetical protein L1887_33920 [Cichorium endivia]
MRRSPIDAYNVDNMPGVPDNFFQIIGDYGPPLRTQSGGTFNHQDEMLFVRHVSVKLSDAENQSLGSSFLTLLIFKIEEDTERMVQFSHNHGGLFQIEKNRVSYSNGGEIRVRS